MTPEIQKLNDKIDALQKELDALKDYRKIPFEIQKAFTAKGFLFTDAKDAGIDIANYVQDNSLSGDPETIQTLGFPTQWFHLEGTDFVIPVYKQFN